MNTRATRPVVHSAARRAERESLRVGIKQVDAFTETPLTGNPAGVVPEAHGLTDTQMLTIAREIAASETAFVLPSSGGADLRIRWFTPRTEVQLCGHATIASFHALAEANMFGMHDPGTYRFVLETRSGNLPVTVEKGFTSTEIFLGLNVPRFERAGQYKLDVMRILGLSLEDFENRLPLVLDEYLYVPVRRLHTVCDLKPNFFAMTRFLTSRNLTGLCVFTTETVERQSAVHSRFFAPTVGIDEDPVTGSANGPLGAYLFQYGGIRSNEETMTIVGEQGDSLGRRGRVTIRMKAVDGELSSLEIGGRAVTVFDGQLLIG